MSLTEEAVLKQQKQSKVLFALLQFLGCDLWLISCKNSHWLLSIQSMLYFRRSSLLCFPSGLLSVETTAAVVAFSYRPVVCSWSGLQQDLAWPDVGGIWHTRHHPITRDCPKATDLIRITAHHFPPLTHSLPPRSLWREISTLCSSEVTIHGQISLSRPLTCTYYLYIHIRQV